MIIDITGIVLTPGNMGKDCLGNGEHFDEDNNLIECCCDECNYMLCCLQPITYDKCKKCDEVDCPNKNGTEK